jgi:hypothetical protein
MYQPGFAVYITFGITNKLKHMATDQEFIHSLTQDFFRTKRIRETLALIADCEISGWEKWLQIELARHYNSRDDVKAWDREVRYALDRRSTARAATAIDFLIHQKHKHSPLGIELKQVKSPRACVKAMLKDKKKVWNIKWSQDNLRDVWCIGVHNAEDPKRVRAIADFEATELKYDFEPSSFLSERIGRTEFSFTVFR